MLDNRVLDRESTVEFLLSIDVGLELPGCDRRLTVLRIQRAERYRDILDRTAPGCIRTQTVDCHLLGPDQPVLGNTGHVSTPKLLHSDGVGSRSGHPAYGGYLVVQIVGLDMEVAAHLVCRGVREGKDGHRRTQSEDGVASGPEWFQSLIHRVAHVVCL